MPDNEPDTVALFSKKVKELALVSNATFQIMCPLRGDLDSSLRGLVA